LSASAESYCKRCGLSTGPYLRGEFGCQLCETEHWPIEGLCRVGSYESLLGALIRKFKYNRQQALDAPLGQFLSDVIQSQPWFDEIEGFVPVPATISSQYRYGCKPVTLLARQVSRRTGLPTYPVLRIRGKPRPQKSLAARERRDNIRGVFHLNHGASVKGACLCIIDDICTTGATICEAAGVLKRAGAERVYAAVIAKTDPRRAMPDAQ
jgi:ComF family protein